MNRKAFIIALYVAALFLILRRRYQNGGTGIPEPKYIVAPSYLYGILALTSDFLEGLPIVLAAGFTTGLYFKITNLGTPAASTQHPSKSGGESPGGPTRNVPQASPKTPQTRSPTNTGRESPGLTRGG